MQQAVDPLFDLDEGAVIGQVADLALDRAADRVPFGHAVPRVLLGLLHAQRDLWLLLVDAQHDDLDLVPDLHQFAGVTDPLRPGHLADVHQALDALLQLDEGPVAHHVDHGTLDPAADRVLLVAPVPGAGLLLLQAEGDLLLLAVDVQNHDLDFLVDRDHFGRVPDAAPAHVRDVQQAVDPAQIDKRAELGDVLDHALANLAFFQFLQQLLRGPPAAVSRSGCGG